MKWWAVPLLGASVAYAYPQLPQLGRRNGTYSSTTPSTALSASAQSTSKQTTFGNSTGLSSSVSTSASSAVTPSPVVSGTGDVDVVIVTATVSSTVYEFPTSKLGPIATLAPVIPTDHDMGHIGHLTPHPPNAGAVIHYAQESNPVTKVNLRTGSSAGIYAVVTPRWKVPSVVLDHSAMITSVEVSSMGNLIIIFQDLNSFDHIASSWDASQDIIFITFTLGCGDYDKNQRCYYQAGQLIFDINTLTVVAIGQARPIGDAAHDINVSWGTYGDHEVVYGSGPGESSPTDNPPSPTPAATEPPPAPTTTGKCAVPADTKYGLPTACLGPYFDQDLDDGLGYFNASDFSFADDLGDVDLEEDWDTPGMPLRRRGILFDKLKSTAGKAFDSAKNGVAKIQSSVTTTVKNAKKDVIKAGESIVKVTVKIVEVGKVAATVIKNAITGTPNIFEKDFDKLLLPRPAKECKETKRDCKPIDPDLKAVKSPWGDDAILLKSFGTPPKSTDLLPVGGKKQTTKLRGKFVNIYCVKCGLSGNLKTSGNITIENIKGITNGYVNADVDLTIGLGLGIFAQDILTKTFRNNLYDIPLSPFTLGFVTVGPILSIGTELQLTANVTGSMLARADVSLTRAKFTYDWNKGGKMLEKSFKPQFKPKFEAEGELTLSAQFGIPVGLEFALTTFNGCTRCKGSVGFETMPSVKAAAAIGVEASAGDNKTASIGLKAINNCTGISTSISVRNDVKAVFKGFGLIQKNWTLHETKDYILASYCIGNKTDGTGNAKLGLHERSLPEISYDYTKYDRRQISNTSTTTSSNTTNSTSVGLVDLTAYAVNELDDYGYTGSNILAIPYDLDDESFEGYWFSTLSVQDTDNEYILASCSDGNVYVQKNSTLNELPWYITCTALWAGYEDVVLSTPTGGVLHYYNNTMSKVGVSRLRTADDSALPGESVYVALAPFYYEDDDDSDDGPSLLAAVTNDDIFFPVVCTYKDSQSAKIYLITSDIDAGIEMLKSPDIEYSITNGEVDDCYLLSLGITDRTDGDWADWDDDAEEMYNTDELDLEFDDDVFDEEGNLIYNPDDYFEFEGEELDYSTLSWLEDDIDY
ncbi:uncharacterized protein BP5553_02391 [Venustampulla echinocandica]|uniref:DUF7029 domain-containing protein n=1 Tax=Venustampulla echinocandica TaxID=2656787 RepID=A0A370U3R5_9HELO|nr:uncharacterized protein BP5553_02391 [Venustampulla echinocandica]RDL42412.1 hypothetical protein BP5553_02391 [Venustampulla echinocandica]